MHDAKPTKFCYRRSIPYIMYSSVTAKMIFDRVVVRQRSHRQCKTTFFRQTETDR
jgi:hypothetical protein